MGKNLIVLGFLVIVGLSLYIFFARDDRSLKQRVGKQVGAKEPRILIEDFTVYRYREHAVEATLSGKLASFLEPNILEMYGDIRGFRNNGTQREFLAAESATTYFNQTGLAQLMKDSSVAKTELENDVRVGSSQHTLTTQFAEYLAREDVLRSDLPVDISGPKGQFHGEKGFRYEITKGLTTINGPIRGVFQGERLEDLAK